MIHEIILPNRDGANLKLVSQDGKCWEFQVDESYKYVLEYIRIAYENDNHIFFIDPSGGPMIIRNHHLFDTHYFVDDIIFDDNDKLQLFLSEK